MSSSSPQSQQLSPILRASIDALEEAIDHYLEAKDKRYKSCVISCDQAIELILKAKVSDIGRSIYTTNNGKTRSIYMDIALNILVKNKIPVPELIDLETIHGHRNPIQHTGAPIPKASAELFLDITYKFMERFLKDEFNTELKDVIESQYYEAHKRNISKSVQLVSFTDWSETAVFDIDNAPNVILVTYRDIKRELDRRAQTLNLAATTTLDTTR